MLYFPIAIIATASISLILFPLIWFIEWLQKDSNERPIFVEEAQKEIEAVKCLLSSHDFISNTPADIIAKARGNLAEMESKLEELQKPHK